MDFITHNDSADIITESTWLQGTINAGYSELVDLFGEPGPSDGYKSDAEWQIRFSDDTVATIYNYKNGPNYLGKEGKEVKQIGNWHVGGTSSGALDKVQIALDLHREQKAAAASGPASTAEELMHEAKAMMETVKAAKGDVFARTVMAAVLVRKMGDITSMLMGRLVQEHKDLPPQVADKMAEVLAGLAAKVITNTAGAGNLDMSKETCREVTVVAEKLMDLEARSANEMLREIVSKPNKRSEK